PQCARVRPAGLRSRPGRWDRPHHPRPRARISARRPAAMSDQTDRGVAPMARVIEVDAGEDLAPRRPLAPRIIPTERTERVTPSEPAPVAVGAPDAPRRRDRVMTFGLAGVAALFVGWLAVDAAGWIAAAFERSTALGVLAATAVTAGVAGAGAVIARELGSLFRLRSVEAIHRRLA